MVSKLNMVRTKGSHDCNHDNLFIPAGATDILDPNGLLKANMESLHLGDQLDTHAMSEYNEFFIKRWGGMDMDSFKTKEFISAIKDLQLLNNSLSLIEHFYSSL